MTVKRYVDKENKDEVLFPKKLLGRKRKLDATAMQALEHHLSNYPDATLAERRNYLRVFAGARVSEATVSRAIKRLGWNWEEDRWVRRR